MSRHDDDVVSADVMSSDVMSAEEFADVRAALGLALPPVAPSPDMKDRVMVAIATTPQVASPASNPVSDVAAAVAGSISAVSGPAEARAQARWFSRPATLVMAAAAAVALFFAGVFAADVVSPRAPSASDQLAAIVAAPDVSTFVSPVDGGATATLVSSESVGLSAMVFDGLQPLSDDERYALWYITDGIPALAGVFAVESGGAVVQVLEGTFEAGTIVGVTVEPASGGQTPTSDPIVAISTA